MFNIFFCFFRFGIIDLRVAGLMGLGRSAFCSLDEGK